MMESGVMNTFEWNYFMFKVAKMPKYNGTLKCNEYPLMLQYLMSSILKSRSLRKTAYIGYSHI